MRLLALSFLPVRLLAQQLKDRWIELHEIYEISSLLRKSVNPFKFQLNRGNSNGNFAKM
jgi:hypothetical protein